MLLKALSIAKRAHRGQTDKGGMPYWLHPYRVGLSVAEYGEDAMVVGFLHDVVEDTDITLRHLSYIGFWPHILDAVGALTRKEGESYKEYIGRVENNTIAMPVKIADLTDNLREDRLRNLWGTSRFRRKTMGMYQKCLATLTKRHDATIERTYISHDSSLCQHDLEGRDHSISFLDLNDPPACFTIEKKGGKDCIYVQINVVETKQKEQKQ